MSGYHGPSRKRYWDHVFVWDRKFANRQHQAYRAEESNLEQDEGQSALIAFLDEHRSRLDPPDHNFTELRTFLEKSNDIELLSSPSKYSAPLALLDDRRDTTGWQDSRGERHAARNWNGYANYPPEGDNVYTELFSAGDLYRKLLTSRQGSGTERRVIYISDMSPLCALAIASTCSKLQAPVLRYFLQRCVSYRVYFGVVMPFGFAMEFHLPYYALRYSEKPKPDPRNLRRHSRFIDNHAKDKMPEFLYEAQVSVLVTGVDEWFWTAYCCADTYFGSEETIQFYHKRGLDAPTGGVKPSIYPVWNPREYFLLVLSRRFRQVTKEWANVINALEGRLHYHEERVFSYNAATSSFSSLADDPGLSLTREYTWTLELLRLLDNSLVKIIESWENFDESEIRYFKISQETSVVRETWDGYLAGVEKDMIELRFFRRLLRQRIEMFEHMRTRLVGASSLVESRFGTEQGAELRKVTVGYLPLSLTAAIFSTSLLSQQASWIKFTLVLLGFTLLTAVLTSRVPLLRRVVKMLDRRILHTFHQWL